jgi:elongation factor G
LLYQQARPLRRELREELQVIIDRLTPNAIPIQLPIGTEVGFQSVVNLLENKAYTFEGEHGEKIVEIPIPADMKGDGCEASP